MNKIRLQLLMVGLVIPLAFYACKGKTGDRGETGPTGPGAVQTTYTGTISSTNLDISAPALAVDSIVQVVLTTGTINWIYVPSSLNFTTKVISVGTINPQLVGGTYTAVVQN